ncbi:MAG: ribonuclease HI [bacterium]
MQKNIEIYTDGSSLGNPGRGGWGVVVTSGDKVVAERGGYEADTTNNRMELGAMIEALKYISEANPNEVVIHADSAYVLGGLSSWIANWERNGWKTANKKPVMNQDLWQELIALKRELKNNITFAKVKGHAGVLHNERADEIATSCAELQRNHDLSF